MTTTREILEVHLEDAGQRFWLAALANTLTGSYGSAQFRFVACQAGHEADPPVPVVTGATFPVMRAQDLDNLHQPNAWLDVALERLAELDQQLVADGWERIDQGGRHWWSRTYAR